MFHDSLQIPIASRELLPPTPALFDAARRYVDRGWSVIPLVNKRPAVKAWKEFQARPPVDAELARWFDSRRLKPTGIGVVTGRLSDLVVVDCDALSDATYWQAEFPPSPVAVDSGGGGVHFYYQAHPEIDVFSRTRIFQRRIDVRGEGGYIVAPPSLHTSGRHYAWREAADTLSGALPTVDPTWFNDCQPLAELTVPVTGVIKHAAAYVARIRAISGEGGHNATFRAACKLRDADLSREEAFLVMQKWNLTNAEPPWTDAELHHKISSAYQEGRG